MIDIFLNEGPHFMETFSFWDLAYGCLEEIGKFSVALLLSIGLFLAARRIRQKSLRTADACCPALVCLDSEHPLRVFLLLHVCADADPCISGSGAAASDRSRIPLFVLRAAVPVQAV